MVDQYEVLNPWAEVDPVPFRNISPRVTELTGKTVGLFCRHFKISSEPILKVIEKRLRERFPGLKFSWFMNDYNMEISETKEFGKFQEWVKGVDTVITAVGD